MEKGTIEEYVALLLIMLLKMQEEQFISFLLFYIWSIFVLLDFSKNKKWGQLLSCEFL